MISRALTSLATLLLGSSLIFVSASASAQPSAAKHAQGMYQDGIKERDAKRYDGASTLFEQAYRVHPRALYLHEAAKSNQHGEDADWALLLAQCAQIEKTSPLTSKVAKENKALIAALQKKTASLPESRPKPLSFYCSTLSEDVRIGTNTKPAIDLFGSEEEVDPEAMAALERAHKNAQVKPGSIRPLGLSGETPSKDKVRGDMTLKAIGVRGPCKKSDILRVERAKLPALNPCYTWQLRGDPTIKGEFTMSWDISKEGSVLKVRTVESRIKSPEVTACMERAISHMRFPKTKKTCAVTQTFSVAPVK